MKKKVISGILATMFLVTMVTVALPVRVSADWWVGDVEIGIVGPKGWIQWDGLWEGACMARDLINREGYFAGWPGYRGIMGPTGPYRVVLRDIDEHAVPVPDPTSAISELLTKLETYPNMVALFGGFRTECVLPMRETFCDYDAAAAPAKRLTWTIAGAATDQIVDCSGGTYDVITGKTRPKCGACVRCDYERYKYIFRLTPMNSSCLGNQLALGELRGIVIPKLKAICGLDPLPTYIMADNLIWADPIVNRLQLPIVQSVILGITVKGVRRISPIATDFSSDFDAAEDAGAKLVIHVFAALAGANFIKQYGEEKRDFACVGINVESQLQEFYASVAGACEYETFLAASGTQVDVPPLNPNAKPLTSTQFWDLHTKIYGHSPVYTAWASYGAIIGLNETSYDPIGSGNPSAGKGWMVHWLAGDMEKRITHTETLGVTDGFAWKRVDVPEPGRPHIYYSSGIQGLFRYEGKDGKLHDVYAAPDAYTPLWTTGVARAWLAQWQAGRMEVTFPRDQPASRKWIIPAWMYPHPDDPTKPFETDFAGNFVPTGVDTLSYTTPDGTVDSEDLDAITEVWFKDLTGLAGFHRLEADMMPYDHYIDVYDAAKVGRDWGKNAP